MLNTLTDPAPMVQNDLQTEQTHAHVVKVLELERTIDKSAVWQGVYICWLKEDHNWRQVEPELTWKQFIVSRLEMSYPTAQRRIKAALWHLDYGQEIEKLERVDYLRLARFYSYLKDAIALPQALLSDLLQPPDGAGLSDADIIAKYKGVEPNEDEELEGKDTVAIQRDVWEAVEDLLVDFPDIDTDEMKKRINDIRDMLAVVD